MARKAKDVPPTSPAEGSPPNLAAPAGDEPLLTTRQLMEFLNVSRTKVWELVNKQGLPAFKIGGDYRYRRSEVLRWLEKYRVQPSSNPDEPRP